MNKNNKIKTFTNKYQKFKKKHPNIIILSCLKYKNGNITIQDDSNSNNQSHESDSWEKIKSNFKDHLLFIFFGNPNQTNLFEFDEKNKELSIKTGDHYENIPTKTWLAYYYWYYHVKNKGSHLITFGDDCYLDNGKLFTNTTFENIDYGGVLLHGPVFKNGWHNCKVGTNSIQYNKCSPRPNSNTKWVHEGTGVIFSKKGIKLLLDKHNLYNNIKNNDIKRLSSYIHQTCWYNDVLLSHEFDDLNIVPEVVDYFGVMGDRTKEWIDHRKERAKKWVKERKLHKKI